jgi:hypothetical protein
MQRTAVEDADALDRAVRRGRRGQGGQQRRHGQPRDRLHRAAPLAPPGRAITTPCQEHHAQRGDGGAAGAHHLRPPRAVRQQRQPDARPVKQAGGDDEAQAVGERIGGLGQLGAMRMAMEDGEHADDQRGHPQRRTRRRRHHRAEHDGRRGDAHFHRRQRHAQHAERAAEGHDQREHHRQQPDRRAPEEGTPQAHGHHGHHVVPAGDGVEEAGHEAAGGAGSLVGEGRRGRGGGQQQGDELVHDQKRSCKVRRTVRGSAGCTWRSATGAASPGSCDS